jgi:hypothetical protein
MAEHMHALTELQGLLGPDATDDVLWYNLRRFEQTALPIITTRWQLDAVEEGSYWQLLHLHDADSQAQHTERLTETVDQLLATLGADAASHCAAAFFLHPQLWQPAYVPLGPYYNAHSQGHVEVQLLHQVAEACLRSHTPPDWTLRLARRILVLCLTPGMITQPDLACCVGYLLGADHGPTADLLDALTLGDWPTAWDRLERLAGPAPRPAMHALRSHWQEQGIQHAITLLRRLYRQNRLDGRTFRQALEATPNSLGHINYLLAYPADPAPSIDELAFLHSLEHINYLLAYPADPAPSTDELAFLQTLRRLADAVLWDMLCDLRPESWQTLQQVHHLSGGRFLLRLVEEVERQGIDRLPANRYYYQVNSLSDLLSHLFSILQQRDEDDSAQLIALLRQVSAPALLATLPHARPYSAELCAALGWPGSEALIGLLHRLEDGQPAHSTDPTAGVLHRQEILDIAAAMDETHLRTLLDSFAERCSAAVTLVQAALGWNRTPVRRLFGRRSQLAARAIGLLPLEKPDELLQRYLALTRYQREANSSGAGRKAYERAAAQAGLANLAYQAGYADVTRLEWAMEDRLGAETVALGRQWAIEGYTLTLVLGDRGPAITVHSPRRQLKRTPTIVRRDYVYLEVRATLEQAQDQERRYRLAFQGAMRSGQPLRPDELALLKRNPLAAGLLERLVLIDESGAVGLFRAADASLEGVHGERVQLSGAVTVAHPLLLAEVGLLADWQAEIIKRQIVQPFKQVFREQYVLTPVEASATYSSARLAGRRMRGRQAMAVLANLGWVIDSYGTVRKPFYEHGFAAQFQTGAYFDRYDEGDDRATTGALEFWPLRFEGYHPGAEQRIPLAQIPALVFSEVLRDLDTVTVIAHQSDEQGTSQEVLRQRGDLVRATAAALGLAQVHVEEPHVFVRGRLAGYRIHLATGAIYLESGQYLCIVSSPKQRKAIFLPFEDGGELVSSEIVSKVVLLANDTAITDGSILAQIVPLRQAAWHLLGHWYASLCSSRLPAMWLHLRN